MSSRIEQVQAKLATLRTGNGRRYSPELRREVAAAATELWRGGTGWCEVAKALGMPLETIRRFCIEVGADGEGRRPGKGSRALRRALVPVKVVEAGSGKGGLVLASPGGYEVRGLDLAEAAELLRRLG